MRERHRCCEALTTKGTRCRNEAVAYHPDGRGGEVLICKAHQWAARQGQLRLPATKRG